VIIKEITEAWNENTAEFWNLFLLQVNVTRYFYLLVSNGNLTLIFHAWVVAIVTDKSVTLVHTVRINKQEATLVARPETLTWYKFNVCTSLCLVSSAAFKYLALMAILKNANFKQRFSLRFVLQNLFKYSWRLLSSKLLCKLIRLDFEATQLFFRFETDSLHGSKRLTMSLRKCQTFFYN